MKKSILKLTIVFVFLLTFTNVSAQQFLWSTKQTESTKYVPLEEVTNEVLNFYNHYDFYYDGTGYSKAGFLKFFLKYDDKSEKSKVFKKMIQDTQELTVIAFKSNSGKGSEVMVMCINKENVELIVFSNNWEIDAISTDDASEFIKWFNGLLE